MMAALRRLPVVVVLGATGTGKSKLAIELGQRFGGEIISADSMQLYKGLDVITNKVTGEEQAQCPHHLLSVLDPFNSSNTVVHFRDMALPLMEKLLEDNIIPIIVGGTNYYIEALLWNFLIDKETADLARVCGGTESPPEDSSSAGADLVADSSPFQASSSHKDSVCISSASSSSCHLPSPPTAPANPVQASVPPVSSVDSESSESDGSGSKISSSIKVRQEKEGKYAEFNSQDLHSLLQKVDPASAKRLHPKNRRKIVRALLVYDNYGVPMSQIHQAQHIAGSTPGLSGALRFPHCCVFWLHTQQEVLDKRLDSRVEDMLRNGLVTELHNLHCMAARNGEPDYTLGIFQSIGFKEFHEYLILPVDERETPTGKKLFEKGVEGLKLATRQYARKQLKWIKNRFLKREGLHVPAIYRLDSTDPAQWLTQVLQPAISILTAVIECTQPPVQPMCRDSVLTTVHVPNVCDVCGGRAFTTVQEWQAHLGSKKHKKLLWKQRHRERAEVQ